jgi:hypothetical protein
MRIAPASLLPLVLLALAPLHADRLVTQDGRILEVKKARQLPDGNYQLAFESGAITCPKQYVASVEIEGDMSDYVPANDDEKQKLAQGYVRYRGKWLGKAAYTAELAKQSELSKARTADLAAHAKFYDGWEKDTKHFHIKSNTSPEILDAYAELLETYYDLMDQRVGIDPSPSLKKARMSVSIYKNRKEFNELTKSPPGVAGFFSSSLGELHFYHDYQDPSVSEWIALHEGTHLLTFLIEPQAQPCIWINEGVADYFGSATVARNKKGKLEIQPGQLSLERILTVQQAIADGSSIPLEKLFTIPRDDYKAFEYAHGWSFVYFLNNAKPEYEKSFKKFFKDLYTIAKGVDFQLEPTGGKYGALKVVSAKEVRRLLLDRLGVKDVAKLEDEWKTYISGIAIDAPRARLKRGLQALYVKGEDEEKKGLEDLEAAITAGIAEPRAFWGRSILRLIVKGGYEDSLADMQKAVELAPLDAGMRSNLAQLTCGLTLRTPGLTVNFGAKDGKEQLLFQTPEALGAAREDFDLACELAPENDLVATSRKTFLELVEKLPASK